MKTKCQNNEKFPRMEITILSQANAYIWEEFCIRPCGVTWLEHLSFRKALNKQVYLKLLTKQYKQKNFH